MKPSQLFTSIVVFCLLFLVSGSCYGKVGSSFLLFYSNNIMGETEPCG